MLGEMKAYADLSLINYKLEKQLEQIKKENLELLATTISIESLQEMFIIYDKDSLYVKDEHKLMLHTLLTGEEQDELSSDLEKSTY